MRIMITLLTMLILTQETAASGRNRCSKHNCEKLFIENRLLCMDCLDEAPDDDQEPSCSTACTQSVEESREDTSFGSTSQAMVYSTTQGIQLHPALKELAKITQTISRPLVGSDTGLQIPPPQSTKITNPSLSGPLRWVRGNTIACEDNCQQFYPHRIVERLKQCFGSPELNDQMAQLEVYPTSATHTNMMDYLNDRMMVVITVTTDGQNPFYITLIPLDGVVVMAIGDIHFQISYQDILRFLNWLTHNQTYTCQPYITSYQGQKQ